MDRSDSLHFCFVTQSGEVKGGNSHTVGGSTQQTQVCRAKLEGGVPTALHTGQSQAGAGRLSQESCPFRQGVQTEGLLGDVTTGYEMFLLIVVPLLM